MKNIILILLLSSPLTAQVTLSREKSFRIPSSCQHLALLGSTPHPTLFLEKNNASKNFSKIHLEDFLDVEYLRDSFTNTLQLCMHHGVDHLLIAYLPGHFVELRPLYDASHFERSMHSFFKRIGPQIKMIISQIAEEQKCTIPITLVLPSRKALRKVPFAFNSDDHRIQHYVHSLPTLTGFLPSIDYKVSIINNRGSQQNTEIIRYVSYEYVLNTPLHCSVIELKKEKFHKYVCSETHETSPSHRQHIQGK